MTVGVGQVSVLESVFYARFLLTSLELMMILWPCHGSTHVPLSYLSFY